MNEKVQQTETGNALQRFLKRKKHYFFGKNVMDALGARWRRIVCIAFDRYNYRNAGRADRKSGAGGTPEVLQKRGRTGDGQFRIGYARQAPQLVVIFLL